MNITCALPSDGAVAIQLDLIQPLWTAGETGHLQKQQWFDEADPGHRLHCRATRQQTASDKLTGWGVDEGRNGSEPVTHLFRFRCGRAAGFDECTTSCSHGVMLAMEYD